MDDITIHATTIAPLSAMNLVLVACLVSNRAAAAVITVVRHPVGWVGLTAGMPLAIAARVVRQP